MHFNHGPSHNWGHAIAYHPALADMLGSVNAAILFQQISYWSERTSNPIGVYKTSEDLAEETGLSYREQTTARKILSERGFMVETNKRLEHRIYFRIEWAAFNAAFEDWALANRPALAHSGGAQVRSPRNAQSAIREVAERRSSIQTETTSETTAEKKTGAVAPTPKTPRKKKEDTTLQDWIDALPEDELAIREDDPLYQDGIPVEMLQLAWAVFKERHATSGKKYADWRAAFRDCVRRDYLKLWAIDREGTYYLTTVGKQAAQRLGV